eukprot:TRINITY_DN1382_c0_g1_i1.p1 TRINITY_DN1382_c0_g1~~TRINITY_DN1382_c0_g1_i1.p1  ORF type:complete len:1005 (-),score=199.16 TRINITY_DN1382_c0_g1_i1:2576-5353(-)
MTDILACEFDKEIGYKTQKLQEVAEAICKVETVWYELQALWSQQTYMDEMAEDKAKETLNENGKRKRNRKSIPVRDLYARRPDGQFVQLICPVCKRRDFATQLGFSNHCRIVHRLKFSTYEDASVYCGVPVDESQVPLDDPSRQSKPLSFFVEEKKQAYKHSVPMLGGQHMNKKRKLNHEADDDKNGFGSSSDPQESNISRFYVRKQIFVGNTSQYIGTPEEEESGGPTHKWMVYIRSPEYDWDVNTCISKVRFFLHPSFAPNDIVEVHTPPFNITRSGWGEFPIRIQLHFTDAANKPMNIIHHLKLHDDKSGLQILGAEEEVTLELDRAFFERQGRGSSNDGQQGDASSSTTKAPMISFDQRLQMQQIQMQGGDISQIQFNGMQPQMFMNMGDSGMDPNMFPELFPQMQFFLHELAMERWPLISGTKYQTLPFSCARSMQEWNGWTRGKQKSSEWQRARRMRTALEDEIGIRWTTLQMLKWCTANNYTPSYPPPLDYHTFYEEEVKLRALKELRRANIKMLAAKVKYCKFCGCTHLPIDKFEERQEECSNLYHMKKIAGLSEAYKNDSMTISKFLAPYFGKMIPSADWLTNPSPQLPLMEILPSAFQMPSEFLSPPLQQTTPLSVKPDPYSKGNDMGASGINALLLNPAIHASISAPSPQLSLVKPEPPKAHTAPAKFDSVRSMLNQPSSANTNPAPIAIPLSLNQPAPVSTKPIVFSPLQVAVPPSVSAFLPKVEPGSIPVPIIKPEGGVIKAEPQAMDVENSHAVKLEPGLPESDFSTASALASLDNMPQDSSLNVQHDITAASLSLASLKAVAQQDAANSDPTNSQQDVALSLASLNTAVPQQQDPPQHNVSGFSMPMLTPDTSNPVISNTSMEGHAAPNPAVGSIPVNSHTAGFSMPMTPSALSSLLIGGMSEAGTPLTL